MFPALHTNTTRPHIRTLCLIVLALALLAPAACARAGTHIAQQPPTTGAASSRAPASQPVAPSGQSPSPSSTSPRPAFRSSSADQLAGFFAAAQRMDRQIRDVAAMVNSRISGTTIRVDETLMARLGAIQPDELAHEIPAGLPPRLLQPVMQVYSELVARSDAFNLIRWGDVGSQPFGEGTKSCFAGGAKIAARYPGDLAATRSLAASTAPVRLAARDSHAAAEVLLRALYIRLANSGCGGCGGSVASRLASIVWKAGTDGNGHYDGTINGVAFTADHDARTGWTVVIHAC